MSKQSDRMASKERLELTECVEYKGGFELEEIAGNLDEVIKKFQQAKEKLEAQGYYNIQLSYEKYYDSYDSLDWWANRLETDEEVQKRLDLIKWQKDEAKNRKKQREEYEKKELARLMKKYKVKAE